MDHPRSRIPMPLAFISWQLALRALGLNPRSSRHIDVVAWLALGCRTGLCAAAILHSSLGPP
eukprot:3296550-Rhodomonas_salina.2